MNPLDSKERLTRYGKEYIGKSEKKVEKKT